MQLKEYEPLSRYSTFGIGGPARYFLEVKTVEELSEALMWAKDQNLPVFPIGKGSNSLFDDRGFEGLALLNKIGGCTIEGTAVQVGAGFNFSLLGVKTARAGLAGLEFASGIPGSVGGAIFMNAGANGGETADYLKTVTFIDESGAVKRFEKEAITFKYRFSSFHQMKGVIAGAEFELVPEEKARQKQLDIVAYRTKTQPYKDKSCGCIFRNPEGKSAGELIESSGLKGLAIGGAKVSEMHANFIVNQGGATADEVDRLAKEVREIVEKKTGIRLEWELRKVPYDISR